MKWDFVVLGIGIRFLYAFGFRALVFSVLNIVGTHKDYMIMWIACFGLTSLSGILLHFDCSNWERWEFVSWGFGWERHFLFFFVSFFFFPPIWLFRACQNGGIFFLIFKIGCPSVWLWFYSHFLGFSAICFSGIHRDDILWNAFLCFLLCVIWTVWNL